MRAKLIFSLLVLTGLGLLAIPAFSQEESQSNTEMQELNSHQELNLNDDKTLLMDVDAKPPKIVPIVRDAPPSYQPNSKKQEQQKSLNQSAEKTQEDPLSFNFLYYIIQKFKISDIVDD
jgi:hypothetical protein